MSFPDDDLRISGPIGIPVSGSDIRINYNDNCKIIAAANNANIGVANIGPQLIFFFDASGDAVWHNTVLPLTSDDNFHRNPSVDWTSDGIAWAITTGSPNHTFPDQLRFLRCYKSTDNGATWHPDTDFSLSLPGDQNSVKSPRMWIDHSPSSTYKDRIYVIWSNDTKVMFRRRIYNDATMSYIWEPPVQLSGPETTATGSSCDITTDPYGKVCAFWNDVGEDTHDPPNQTGSKYLFFKELPGGGSTTTNPVVKITPGPWFGSSHISIPSFTTHHKSISGGAYQTVQKIDYYTDDDYTTKNSYIYVVWADLNGGSGCKDPGDAPGTSVSSSCRTRIWFSRSNKGGISWDAPKMINDSSNLNDQFHPRLAVDETNGQLVVVYYDTINDPGRLRTDIWMQTSEDNGVTWSSAIQVTKDQTDETTIGHNQFQYGDYIGLTGYAGTLFPSWTDRRNGTIEEIWTRLSRVPAPTDQLCSPSDPILTSATVTFTTLGPNHNDHDDKDNRTHVTVDINTARNENAAHIDSDFGEFTDAAINDEKDTYSLQINGPWFTKSRIQKGYVRIRADPTGDDTWIFQFVVDLRFSNNTFIHIDPNTIFTQTEDKKKEIYVGITSQSVIDLLSSPWL